jgi:antitoxin (DNA-binding transcriptional repressor) of toxin-antitoxin stability system
MKVVTITQLKNGVSAIIDRVRAGESILILDRDVPVARLEPVPPAPDDARLARLERAGLVRRGTGEPVPLERLAKPLRPGEKPAGVLEALLEERREGR